MIPLNLLAAVSQWVRPRRAAPELPSSSSAPSPVVANCGPAADSICPAAPVTLGSLRSSMMLDPLSAIMCRQIDTIPKASLRALELADERLLAALSAAGDIPPYAQDPPEVEAALCASIELLNDIASRRPHPVPSDASSDSDPDAPASRHDRWSALAQQAILALRISVDLTIANREESARKMLEVAAGCAVAARDAPPLAPAALAALVASAPPPPPADIGLDDPSTALAAAGRAVLRAQVRLAGQLDCVTAVALSLLGSQRNAAERLAECGLLCAPLCGLYGGSAAAAAAAMYGGHTPPARRPRCSRH